MVVQNVEWLSFWYYTQKEDVHMRIVVLLEDVYYILAIASSITAALIFVYKKGYKDGFKDGQSRK